MALSVDYVLRTGCYALGGIKNDKYQIFHVLRITGKAKVARRGEKIRNLNMF